MAVLLSGGGVSARQVELHVQNPGDLPRMIASDEKYKITKLSLFGALNGTDVRYIREMAGRDVNGNETNGSLVDLYLYAAYIVEGGDAYYYGNDSCYTSYGEIPSCMFLGCDKLKKVGLPEDNVRSIGESAFDGCSSLTSIVIPSSVTSIGESAFDGCSSLTSIVIPSSVTSIGVSAFSGCSGLTSMVFSKSATSVGNAVFYGCSGLASIVLPEAVTSVGASAFGECDGLREIYCLSSVAPSAENETFDGIDRDKCILYVPTGSITSYQQALGWGGFEHIVEKDMLLELRVQNPGDLPKMIASDQKNKVTGLKLSGKLNGTDIRYIREMAGREFGGHEVDGNLSHLDMSETQIVKGGDAYSDGQGYFSNFFYTVNNEISNLMFYCCDRLKSIILPSSVTSIGEYAFGGCSSLTSMVLPESVTSIGKSVFSGCSSLTSMVLPESVTFISHYAFLDCSSLTSIVLPKSVTRIGSMAFSGCSSLMEICSLVSPYSSSVNERAFDGVDRSECVLYVPLGASADYRQHSEWGKFDHIVEKDMSDMGVLPPQIVLHVQNPGDLPKMIGRDQRHKVFSLKLSGELNGTDMRYIREMAGIDVNGLRIDGNLLYLDLSEAQIVEGGAFYFNPLYSHDYYYTSDNVIPSNVFGNCDRLKSIILPSSVTSIGDYAFGDCSSLTSMVLPESVTSIGDYAFGDCSSLTSIVFPSSVTSIGESAFMRCSSLTSIVLPETVTSIGHSAFTFCRGLTSIVLPESVTSIGDYAFRGCYGLMEIYSLASVAPSAECYTFDEFDKSKCILYVPIGSYTSYWLASGWGSFEHIVERDMSDINAVESIQSVNGATEIERYSIDGRRIDKPERGLNVVRMSDGTVRKVIVK